MDTLRADNRQVYSTADSYQEVGFRCVRDFQPGDLNSAEVVVE